MHDIELKQEEFTLFRQYIYEAIGISLSEQKHSLIKGRLSKRVKQLGLKSFHEYYNHLISDESGKELNIFINAISTNVTSFFREDDQWAWLKEYLPNFVKTRKNKKIRIWSAGCSSGEEPYTILMFLQENLDDFENWDIKILATDISSKVLQKAIEGVYEHSQIATLPKETFLNSFEEIKINGSIYYKIKSSLKEKIIFRLYNLITDPFIFTNEFDMIFCRNVMIYFNEEDRNSLVNRFARLLPKDAPLFLGSSESLTAHKKTLKLLGSSIYKKI